MVFDGLVEQTHELVVAIRSGDPAGELRRNRKLVREFGYRGWDAYRLVVVNTVEGEA
jgi:hypothetical protein